MKIELELMEFIKIKGLLKKEINNIENELKSFKKEVDTNGVIFEAFEHELEILKKAFKQFESNEID